MPLSLSAVNIGITIKELINILEAESELTIAWFKNNNILVNTEKIQAIVVRRNSQMLYPLNINSKIISFEKSVKLFQINTNNKLNFDVHISSLSKEANNQ